MTPAETLEALDHNRLWPTPCGLSLQDAYAHALEVRRLRIQRGEQPRGFKIGFTNRSIWPRYNVFAPIWGSVWNTTLSEADGERQVSLSLARACQPRIEPEIVFGMKATPPANATLEALCDAIDWVAPGFEVVQSHLPGWKFEAADTVADAGLHAHLLVGRRLPVNALASGAAGLDRLLAQARVRLHKGPQAVDEGQGSLVLDSPLRALLHFTQTLRACPGAPDLQTGDVVTTGTWTDAWPVEPGEHWSAHFDAPLGSLSIRFTA